MIDNHPSIKTALETVLPTYYELKLHKGIQTPCISYQETNNYTEQDGDTFGYSRLTYTVKVWGNRLEDLQRYSIAIDAVLRPLGYKRISSGELHDNNSTMIQKIMTFEALAMEEY